MNEPAEPPLDPPDRQDSSSPPQASARPAPRIRSSTLVITNLGKAVSLVIAFHEMVIRHTARESVIAYCALALIGTQTAEEIIIRAIDRIFGSGQ